MAEQTQGDRRGTFPFPHRRHLDATILFRRCARSIAKPSSAKTSIASSATDIGTDSSRLATPRRSPKRTECSSVDCFSDEEVNSNLFVAVFSVTCKGSSVSELSLGIGFRSNVCLLRHGYALRDGRSPSGPGTASDEVGLREDVLLRSSEMVAESRARTRVIISAFLGTSSRVLAASRWPFTRFEISLRMIFSRWNRCSDRCFPDSFRQK